MSAAQLDDQTDAIAFLSDPATYGPDVADVERIDTHISSVFLAGDLVYKLKRSVAFSFLDFSTLAKREEAARAELALNRRTAPEIYLRVQPIVRDADGRLAFDGAGETIDWVVVMRRFDQNALFSNLAARGELTDDLMERLAAAIAGFHAAAERCTESGGSAGIAAEIEGDAANLRLVASSLDAEACEALIATWNARFAALAPLLDQRLVEGRVRRCHGDLHLRNICLWKGEPTLFDGIEFNERFSTIDVLYDLAFLLMDLEHRGLDGFANLVFNAYFDRDEDADGTATLPLFLSLRAAIRAFTGVASANAQDEPWERDAALKEARAYLLLAIRLCTDVPPRLVAIGGLSGSGKSTLSRALGSRLGRAPGARLLHSDAIRKRQFGVTKTTRLGEHAYTSAASEAVYREQRELAAAYLRAGQSVIVESTFTSPEERAAIEAVAAELGVHFAGFWLDAPPDVLRDRVAKRTGDMSDATVPVLESQLRRAPTDVAWMPLDASLPISASVARANDLLGG